MNQPIMQGGSKVYIIDIFNKYSLNINIYLISTLVISIVFVKEIPLNIRSFAGSFLGRLVTFILTILFAYKYSWIAGLLMSILLLLMLSLGPRTVAEGFQSPYTNIKPITEKHKWFVEKVFKENPRGIEEDNVTTKAIQDGSNGSSSTSGQGGSHR